MTEYLFEHVGTYYQRWLTQPPEYGIGFIVTDQEWIKSEDGKFIRVIKSIKLYEHSLNENNPNMGGGDLKKQNAN